MQNNHRVSFGSKIAAVLVAAGSAVGLGNIWRFPYEAGNHGGAAFILVYLGCVFFLGLPIMIAEFTIGRRSKASTGKAYQMLAPGTPWRWVGIWCVAVPFFILGYYAVVAGWTLEYILQAGLNQFTNKTPEDYIASFQAFSQNPIRPILWLAVFMGLTHFVIVRGVKNGIEKSSKLMMPILFIILILLAVGAMLLPNADKGLSFLFYPDFSQLNADVFLGAMGQSFYSLSLGMGCLTTYASYFSKETNLGRTAIHVGVIDSLVAILAGCIIFPAAFSVGIQPDAGPSLIFITLPNVFQQAFTGIPLLGYVASVMFYVLLALAALTSTISLHEVSTAYLHEAFHFSRGKAARFITVGCFIIGIFSSLSLGALKDYTFWGMCLFDFIDFFTAKIMLPIGGLLACLFVGWYLKKTVALDEVSNNGTLHSIFFSVYIFLLRYVAPVGILLIFISEWGLL